MLRNRKGFADLVVYLLIGLAAIVGVVGSNVAKGTIGWKTQNVNKTMHTKESSTPTVLGVDEKGRQVIGYKMTKEASTEAISETPQPTLWDKLKSVFWVIVILVILAAIFPAGIVAKLMSRAKQAISDKLDDLQEKHDELKSETTKIVQGVAVARAGMDDATKAKMSAVLKDSYNDSTKDLVKDIKDNGTITKE